MQISRVSLDQMVDEKRSAFGRRVARYLRDSVPEAKELSDAALAQRVDDGIGAAESNGFASERGIAFWCEVSLRTDDLAWKQPAIRSVLQKTETPEAERMEQIIAILEDTGWDG